MRHGGIRRDTGTITWTVATVEQGYGRSSESKEIYSSYNARVMTALLHRSLGPKVQESGRCLSHRRNIPYFLSVTILVLAATNMPRPNMPRGDQADQAPMGLIRRSIRAQGDQAALPLIPRSVLIPPRVHRYIGRLMEQPKEALHGQLKSIYSIDCTPLHLVTLATLRPRAPYSFDRGLNSPTTPLVIHPD